MTSCDWCGLTRPGQRAQVPGDNLLRNDNSVVLMLERNSDSEGRDRFTMIRPCDWCCLTPTWSRTTNIIGKYPPAKPELCNVLLLQPDGCYHTAHCTLHHSSPAQNVDVKTCIQLNCTDCNDICTGKEGKIMFSTFSFLPHWLLVL